MITAEKLKTLTTFTAAALTRAINLAGDRQQSFTRAEFLGMTNAGQFCYSVNYFNAQLEQDAVTKVFVNLDQSTGQITVGY